MKQFKKPNGTPYWSYILVYVDDLLVVHHDLRLIMERIAESYELKNDTFGRLTQYLGANISLHEIPEKKQNGFERVWSMSANGYIKEAIKTVKETTQKED